MATFNGTDGNDSWDGGSDNDSAHGNGGNDSLAGWAGDDVLDGDDGNDSLYGGAGSDTLHGGNGNDFLMGFDFLSGSTDGMDTLDGGAGDDILVISGQASLQAGETFIGGTGNDELRVAPLSPTGFELVDLTAVSLNIGSDIERISAVRSIVRLTPTQFLHFSQAVGSFQFTESGTFDLSGRWSPGPDSGGLRFAAGDDILHYDGGEGHGGEGDDQIVVTGSINSAIYGDGGNDQITGGSGDDVIYGGAGDDVVAGGDGHDEIHDDAGTDSIDGGGGDDWIFVDVSKLSAGDTFKGGSGTDTLYLSNGSQYQPITIGGTQFAGDFEKIEGSGVNLVMSGATLTNLVYLVAPVVTFTSGVNIVMGLQSGLGIDVTNVILADATNSIDMSRIASGHSVTGGAGADTIIGTAGFDGLFGNAGDDILHGGGGDDDLDGGAGADWVDGGDGNDRLIIAQGETASAGDRYTGGTGIDTLLVRGSNSVSTFVDLTPATFDSGIERISIEGNVTLLMKVAQLASFGGGSSLAIQFADGGKLDLTGRDFQFLGLTLNDAGNEVLLSGGTNTKAFVTGGAGNDKVVGTDGDDTVTGGGGNDIVDGGKGADFLRGGMGDDIINGGAGADSISDEAGVDSYNGGDGDDIFQLGGDVQHGESFSGGDGYDWLFVTDDAVDLSAVTIDGMERISAPGDLSLTASQADQFLRITTTALHLTAAGAFTLHDNGLESGRVYHSDAGNAVDLAGTTHQLQIYGGNGDDVIITGSDNDELHGGGGADQMLGGAGNDIYYTDRVEDLVFENAGGGTDTVIATGSYYLYANIENLTLAAGAGNIFGVGNELANTITGNEGGNTLLAGAGDDVVHGGAGVDIVYGEDGADQLFGDADNDVIVAGAGNDTIDGGTGGDLLYGEDGNDTIWGGSDFVFDQLVGGAGDDVLHGDSGLGDFDYLIGNAGNDTYYVDTYADLTFENAGEGTDTVYASTVAGSGYYLYANVENLVLVGNTFYGVGNELANAMTGNALDNWLLGGAGNDILNGKAGNDVLFGQDGADTFVFDHGTGADTIADFTAGADRIDLSAFGFASFQQVQAAMVENGGSTAIVLGNGDLIVLQNVANASLHSGDFILSGGSAAQVKQLVRADPADDTGFTASRSALIHQLDVPGLHVAADSLAQGQF